jgi:hypothetical protein
MTIQLYLIHPKQNEDDNVREEIATYIAQREGFILMATSYGSLVAAFDDTLFETVKAHHLVEFASGVTLNPNAPGAAALQQMFVQNMAAQLIERGQGQPEIPRAARTAPPTDRFPPGYRPLYWGSQNEYENNEEGGE